MSLLRAGAVTADCGLVFEPLVLWSGRLGLPGSPVEPAQVCPECRRIQEAAVKWGESVTDLRSHAVEVGADGQLVVYYVALCGHRLLAAVTGLTESCRTRCGECSAVLARRAARRDGVKTPIGRGLRTPLCLPAAGRAPPPAVPGGAGRSTTTSEGDGDGRQAPAVPHAAAAAG